MYWLCQNCNAFIKIHVTTEVKEFHFCHFSTITTTKKSVGIKAMSHTYYES